MEPKSNASHAKPIILNFSKVKPKENGEKWRNMQNTYLYKHLTYMYFIKLMPNNNSYVNLLLFVSNFTHYN